MDAGVVRDRGLDRVGVGHDDHQLARMCGDDRLERGDHARLHLGQRLTAGETRARRRALDRLPEIGLGQLRQLAAGPLAVVGFDHAGQRLHGEPVTLGNRRRGLGGALDRAGVDHRDRQAGEPLGESPGLLPALLGEVDPRRAAREHRAGLGGDGMTRQHRGAWRPGAGSPGSESGFGSSVTPPNRTGAPYPRRRDRPARLLVNPGSPRDRPRPGAPRCVGAPGRGAGPARAGPPGRGLGVRGRVAALPRRLGPPRGARPRPGRGLCLLPRRVPPGPRPPAPVGVAGFGLRAVGAPHQPGFPARARRPARAARRPSANTTRNGAATNSSTSWSRPGTTSTTATTWPPERMAETHEAGIDHRHHGPGRPLPRELPVGEGLPGVRPDPGPEQPEGRARDAGDAGAWSWSTATSATCRRSSPRSNGCSPTRSTTSAPSASCTSRSPSPSSRRRSRAWACCACSRRSASSAARKATRCASTRHRRRRCSARSGRRPRPSSRRFIPARPTASPRSSATT